MGKHVSDFEGKVKWLVEHPSLTLQWPVHVTSEEIIRQMRSDNLISDGTHNYDLSDLNKVVAEAKSRIRKLKANQTFGRIGR